MKQTFPYFNAQAVVPFGIKPWPQPPHEFLANIKLDAESLARFVRIYGTPFENFYLASPMPKTFREALDVRSPDGKTALTLDIMQAIQREVHDAWSYRGTNAELTVGVEGTGLISGPVQTELIVTQNGIEIVAKNIWSYMRLCLAYDSAKGLLHKCRNPACETPYFREMRKGQVYCSHTCAVAVAVQKFQLKKKAKQKAKRGQR